MLNKRGIAPLVIVIIVVAVVVAGGVALFSNKKAQLSPGDDGADEGGGLGFQRSLPDLIVVSLTPTTGACGGGSNQTNITCSLNLRVVVRNIGTNSAGASHTHLLVQQTGTSNIVVGILLTPSLAAGGRVELNQIFTELPVGTYTAYASADWFNVVQESNENNNLEFMAFTLP